MRIGVLELYGFKSFPDRTRFQFGSGVSCIVGPNGCGKSNVVDAVKWCIGEMSAKSLRGSDMQDVIFAGSTARPPVGFAEVSLIFAATPDRPFPGQYAHLDEVQVTRRLHRSGQSEYLINQVKCRRKDITTLFLDTGVSSDLYSFIEQGRVDKVVNATPAERRLLIDEAAGISKYKVRREEAQRRLAATGAQLDRAADVADEMGRRLKTLHRQVLKAARFKRLRALIKQDEIVLSLAKYAALSADRKALRTALRQLRGDEAAVRRERARRETDLAARREELEVVEHALGTWRDEVAEYDATQRELSSVASLNEKRGREIRIQKEAAEREATLASEEAATHRERLVASQEAAETLRSRILSVEAALAEARQQLTGSENIVSDNAREVNAARAVLERSQREVRDRESDRSAHDVRVQTHRARLAGVEQERSTLEGACGKAEARREDAVRERAEAFAACAQLENEVTELEDLLARQVNDEARREVLTAEAALDEESRRVTATLEELGVQHEMLVRNQQARQRTTEAAHREQRRLLVADHVRVRQRADADAETELAKARERGRVWRDAAMQGAERSRALAQEWVQTQRHQVRTASTRLRQLEGTQAGLESRLAVLSDVPDGYPGLARLSESSLPLAAPLEVYGALLDLPVVDSAEALERVRTSLETGTVLLWRGDPLADFSSHDEEGRAIEEYMRTGQSGWVKEGNFRVDGTGVVRWGEHGADALNRVRERERIEGERIEVAGEIASIRTVLMKAEDELARAEERLRAAEVEREEASLLDVSPLLERLRAVQRGRIASLVEKQRASLEAFDIRRESVVAEQLEEDQRAREAMDREHQEVRERSSRRQEERREALGRARAWAAEVREASEEVLSRLELARSNHAETRVLLSEVAARLEQSEETLRQQAQRRVDLETAQDQWREKIAELEGERPALDEAVKRAEESRDAATVKAAEVSERARHAQLAERELQGRVRAEESQRSALAEQVEVMNAQSLELQQAIERSEKRAERAASTVLQLVSGITEAEQERLDALDALGKVEEKRASAWDRFEREKIRANALREGMSGAEKALRELQTRQHELTKEISEQDQEVGRVRMEIDNARQRISERYQTSLPGLLDRLDAQGVLRLSPEEGVARGLEVRGTTIAPVEEKMVRPRDLEDEVEIRASVARLEEHRAQLGKLGEVNLTALQEYAELEERYTELDEQRNDLEASVRAIRAAIAKMNKTCRQRFRDAFDQVNEAFQGAYPRLVGGGSAKLSLTDEEDLLETGVEIFVQPPGKRLTNLTLLSGGEKAMTAIALLLALFSVKPSPFCILDEVDAPLDEGNGARFNDMLREMSRVSQFLVITHNRKTMECADTLYGVTMPTPGVSRLVSVDIDTRSSGAS